MKHLIYIFLTGILISCTAEPRPIKYGLDNCAFCHMAVTEQGYGTELITEKGKIYTFDSIECLIDYCKREKVENSRHLATSVLNPGKLVDAQNLYVIKCDQIPSPMGRFLTAFESEAEAQKVVNEKGGEVLPWTDAIKQF